MRVVLGSDHAGFEMKQNIVAHVKAMGHEVLDVGTDSSSPVDFPDYAEALGMAIINNQADRGILICGSGVGAVVAVNKIPGIRAGICHDCYSAHQGVEHDNMNVLVLGARIIAGVENHHNFAWQEKLSEHETLIIHRKGATPAHAGDVGIIPGNMVSPAFIVSGKGNETSLSSASHGAGRQISRNKAKQTFSKSQLEKVLSKEGVELIGGATDESPMAYKDIFQVMEAQKDLVNILAMFYPKIVRME